ncbi:glycosyltransferase family 9 protein [Uliginosibacterium sp. sgz301328]|uniref:glycosyltransferase family 9 protein n=1 Tax=Uliginosibacterium sp. sgz301328 TaxID=3243764 RepID=UPI00359DD7BB
MTTTWQNAHNVLAIRLDNMGDVLMTTPAMRALRDATPGRRITLLASRAGAALAPHLDCVDDVIAYDAPWVKHAQHGTFIDDDAMIATLRACRFDAAVIFSVYSQNPLPAALMCRLSGIPQVLAHCRENPYALLSDWVPEREPETQIRHEVRRQLDLVAHVGAVVHDKKLVFRPGATARDRLATTLADAGIDGGTPYLVLHAGATAPSRMYPPQAYARAARLLLDDFDGYIVLTGSCAEAADVAALLDAIGHPRARSLAGMLNLGELGALIEGARVLIANNSGPVHLAAALGTPVVDLYALTNPQHTPWMVDNRVLYRDVPCKYCYKSVCPAGHHACLTGVPPDEVAAAARAIWREPAPC